MGAVTSKCIKKQDWRIIEEPNRSYKAERESSGAPKS